MRYLVKYGLINVQCSIMLACLSVLLPHRIHAQEKGVIYQTLPTPIDAEKQVRQQSQDAFYIKYQNPDSAIRLLQATFHLSIQNHYAGGAARALLGMGASYVQKGDYRKALAIFQQAYPYCRLATHDTGIMAAFYNHIAVPYSYLGQLDTAVRYYYKALSLLKQGNPADAATFITVYSNLGVIFSQSRQYDKTIYYLNKAKGIAEAKKDTQQLIKIYVRLGATYTNVATFEYGMKNKAMYARGRDYSQQALSLTDRGKSTSAAHYANMEDQSTACATIAITYCLEEQPALAIPYYERALAYSSNQSTLPWQRRGIYDGLGGAYIQVKNYKKAAFYLSKALEGATSGDNKQKLLDTYLHMVDLYSETGQYAKALQYHQAATSLKDSMAKGESIALINQMEVKYRTAEKDKELAINKLQIDSQQNVIREKNRWIAAAAGASLFMILLLVSLYRNYRHRQHLQAEKILNLQQQHELLEKKQALLQQEQEIKQLKSMMQGEEKERARLARDLHDGIVAQMAAIKMNFSVLQGHYRVLQNAKDFDEALLMLDETAMELRKTAHNLMPEILLQQGLTAAVHTFCEKMNHSSGLNISFHLSGYVPRLDPDFELSIYRMVQELLQNIVKHANATQALVQINCHEPVFILTVEDNGAGFDKNATNTGYGIGLRNMQARVNALQGQFDITTSKGKGTSVSIEFDIANIKNIVSAWV